MMQGFIRNKIVDGRDRLPYSSNLRNLRNLRFQIRNLGWNARLNRAVGHQESSDNTSAPEKVLNGLVECVWSFQMRNVPYVRQFDEASAGNRLGGLFCEFGNVSEIPAQVDWCTIFANRSVVFLSDDEECRNLDLRKFVAYRLLINHQSG